MFTNRTVQVKLVNDRKAAPTDTPVDKVPVDPEKIAKTTVESAVLLVGAYMAADTIRKSVIHIVKTKIK